MANSTHLVLLTVATLLLAPMIGDARPRNRPRTCEPPVASHYDAGNRPAPELREPVACGVRDNVGPWYPSLAGSIAGSLSLSLLLLVIGGRVFSRYLLPWHLRTSQLVPLALLATIAGVALVARLVSGLYPAQSATVPTQGEVTAVLYAVLIPLWLLAATGVILLTRRLAARKRDATTQPN